MTPVEIDLLINAGKAANSLKDVRTSLKAIKSAMLEVGDDSEEFNRLAKAAADLGDRVDDVNQRLKSFNPDGFAALTNFAGKAAGAVSAVSGAMALFGDQSEDVQKALMKVQGALALSQGLDAVKGLGAAYKDLNATIKATTVWQNIMNLFSKQTAVANVVEAETTVAKTVATEGATLAQKALNAAMKANPLGLIIAAITALIAVLYTLNEVMGGASDETIRLNAELEKQKKLTDQLKASTENELVVLEAMGEQDEKIYELKKKMMAQQIADLELSVEVHKRKLQDIQDNDNLYESIARIAGTSVVAEVNKAERSQEERKALEEDVAAIEALKAQLTALDITEENRIMAAAQESAEAQKEAEEKRLADAEQFAKDAEALRKAAHEAEIARLVALGEAEQKERDEKLRAERELADQMEEIRLADLERRNVAAEAEQAEREKFFEQFPEAMRKQQESSLEYVKRLLDEGRISFVEYSAAVLQIQRETDAQRADSQMQLADASISILSNLAALAKQGSNAQKALALGQIAADTGVGFIKGLTVAQTAAAGTGPAAAFAFPIFYASQIAAVLGAAAKAKSALNGGSSGGSATGSSSGSLGSFGGVTAINTPPAQPQQPSTPLNQNGTTTGQNQNPTSIRTYVLESDIREVGNAIDVMQSENSYR